MTYIDRLNHFNRWLESNALPGNAQLMYFKLLNVFNRAGWPESVQVDTLRLMQMLDIADKRTVYRARDKLAEAGFISFQKGSKGNPTRFTLIEYKFPTAYGTESSTKSSTESSTKNSTKNGTYIKNKNKKKKKTEYYTCSLREQGVEPTYDIKELEELAYLRIPDKL